MPDKRIVIEHLRKMVRERIELVQRSLEERTQSLYNETKSSAGDKHETGRAMVQLEQEKLSSQLQANQKMVELISRIDPNSTHESVQFGSMIRTEHTCYFLAIGLGKQIIEEQEVLFISAATPAGKQLMGKKAGDRFEVNGQSDTIREIL